MRWLVSSAAALLASVLLCPIAVQAEPRTLEFKAGPAGLGAAGFTFTENGRGKPGVWALLMDATLGKLVLSQTDSDPANGRFALAIADSINAANVDLSVKFKPINGKVDMAAGLVWRYRDKDNYYVVRANALEDNVVLYKVDKGRRTDLPLKGKGKTYGVKAPVPKETWSTLRVTADGKLFTVFLNGQQLFQVEDETFRDPGKIGLWTKADSVTAFADLTVDLK